MGRRVMAAALRWTEADMPNPAGRRVLVTGANSGIGFETARALACAGAEVLLACRHEDVLAHLKERTVEEAMAAIRADYPGARLERLELDLASQASVKAAARDFHRRFDRLDVLVNNAGVMWVPESKTEDGFETQIGINHFGHFTLTAGLLPALTRTPGSRVVTVTSIAHRAASLDVDDLSYARRRYDPQKAYSQTKLANLLFSRELGRRLAAHNLSTVSVAAHPGLASTNLYAGSFLWSKRMTALVRKGVGRMGQSCLEGARPTLYAATMPGVSNGDYIGPSGFMELWGSPAPAYSTARSRDPKVASELWGVSERATGVEYDFDTSADTTLDARLSWSERMVMPDATR